MCLIKPSSKGFWSACTSELLSACVHKLLYWYFQSDVEKSAAARWKTEEIAWLSEELQFSAEYYGILLSFLCMLMSRHLNFLPAWTPHLFSSSLLVGHKDVGLVFLLTTSAGPTRRKRKITKKPDNKRVCEWKQLKKISRGCAVTACNWESYLHRVTVDTVGWHKRKGEWSTEQRLGGRDFSQIETPLFQISAVNVSLWRALCNVHEKQQVWLRRKLGKYLFGI